MVGYGDNQKEKVAHSAGGNSIAESAVVDQREEITAGGDVTALEAKLMALRESEKAQDLNSKQRKVLKTEKAAVKKLLNALRA